MMRALCRAVLWLYPPRFRRQFGEDWLDVAQWRLQQTGAGRLRALARWILTDCVTAVPIAWWAALADRRRSRRGGGSGGRGAAFVDDVRFAIRSLRRSPAFVAAVAATLAIGIAANVGVFAVVRSVLLKPLPYPQSERLVMIWNEFGSSGLSRLPLSPAQVLALRAEPDLFEEVGGVWATQATLTDLDEPALVSMAMTTTNFHQVLGVEPALGRAFNARDNLAGDGPALILSDELWRSTFGADPAIVGNTIAVEGQPTPVVGVLPPRTRLVLPTDSAVPARFDLYMSYPQPLEVVSAGTFFLRVVARRAPDTPLAAVAERLAAVSDALEKDFAELAQVDMSAVALHADAVREVRPALGALLVGVGLVLLLGCANAAALFSTRLTQRQRGLALRRCLGATRWRMARQQVLEGLSLAGLAGVIGTLGGIFAVRVLWPMRPASVARFESVTFDAAVVGFAVATALLAGLAFALIGMSSSPGPRLPSRRASSSAAGSRRGRLLGRMLLVSEVGATVILLVAAGLMARTVLELRRIDPGFEAGEQLSFRVALSLQRFPEATQRIQLAHLIEEEIGGMSGVTAVGGGSHVPFDDVPNWSAPAAPEGTPEDEWDAYYVDHRSVTPGYLSAVGARLLDGRHFTVHDEAASAAVVIVDHALARRLWPDGSAVGKTVIATQYEDGSFVSKPSTVVGVVETIRGRDLTRPGDGVVFVPFAQSARWQLSYVVAGHDPLALAEPIRQRVAGLNEGIAAADFRPLRGWMSDAMAATQLTAVLAEIFAVIATCLAFAGLYAVVSFAVVQRRPEIGIRMALGASRAAIFRRVVGEGLIIGIAGLAVGIPVALVAAGYLASLVFGVSPADPINLFAVSVATVAVTVAASAGPAWLGARVDPVRSLRS